MANVKSPDRVAAKWARVTPQRTEDYSAGIQAPRTPWAAATRAAADRYKAGVNDAMNRGAFEKGVGAAGDQRWASKSLAKGPSRFAEGVSLSAPDYQSGVQPFLETIAATQLPGRFAKGDPRNLERVKAISTALRKRKTG